MQSFWQKLWFYARLTLVTLIVIFVMTFVGCNFPVVVEPKIDLIFTSYDRPKLLTVLVATSAISIFGWWLFWTVWRTIKQIRDARVNRLHREVQEMKEKAARLQTRPAPTAAPTSQPDDRGAE